MKPLTHALAACLFLATQSMASAAPGDAIYTRPGQLVRANNTHLNMYCMGRGAPAVIFDSGWGDWAPAWAVVQPRVAKFTRACSYDRAGAGFSDAGPMPRTSVQIADELHSALHNAAIEGPYILVGSAFGGDPVRTFAIRYLPEVAGVVLVDADASDAEPAAMQRDDHAGTANFLAKLRACRDAVKTGAPLPVIPATHPGRPALTCEKFFYRGLPEAMFSAQLNATLLHLVKTKVSMYDAFHSEMEQMEWDEDWLKQHRRSMGSRPIRVLTSGQHGIGTAGGVPVLTPQQLRDQHAIALAQASWLGLSSNARQVFVPHSSEYIQLDQPDAVVNAIRGVHDQAK